MAAHILVVDDETDLCDILGFNLIKEGYRVTTADNALDAQAIVDKERVDLIVLDVMMSPKSGFEWASELKKEERTRDIPIIFCTAKTLEDDVLKGFALGSDDYICKPYRMSEAKARIRAVLNRCKGVKENNIVSYKGIVINLELKECTINGVQVPFTKIELEILVLLLTKPGQVFSREEILSKVWPDNTIVLDRTVDVNITRIRKKIGEYGSHIRTRFGYGYYFEA